jgi:hypothetical protein
VTLLYRNDEFTMIKNNLIKLLNFGFVKIKTVENIHSLFLFAVKIFFKFLNKVEKTYFSYNQIEDSYENLTQSKRWFNQDVEIFENSVF